LTSFYITEGVKVGYFSFINQPLHIVNLLLTLVPRLSKY